MKCPKCNSPGCANVSAGYSFFECGAIVTHDGVYNDAGGTCRLGVLEREHNRLKKRVKELEDGLESIDALEPHHDNGRLFYPVFDGEGNEIGAEPVDPLVLIQKMVNIAATTLHNQTT